MPKGPLGNVAFWLAFAFVCSYPVATMAFIVNEGGMPLWVVFLALFPGLGALVAGVLSIVKEGDKTWPVFIAVLVGIAALVFTLVMIITFVPRILALLPFDTTAAHSWKLVT